jgi:mono/diheme cytochrome c family protein
MRNSSFVLAVLAMGAVVGGSVSLAADAKKTEIPAAAVAEGNQVWTTRCSLCHGPAGKGDGPMAGALNPKPRDLSDPKWQGSVDDVRLETVILKGGTAVNLSPMMAANSDLESKPDVVRALRAKVRSLSGK